MGQRFAVATDRAGSCWGGADAGLCNPGVPVTVGGVRHVLVRAVWRQLPSAVLRLSVVRRGRRSDPRRQRPRRGRAASFA